MPSAEVPRGNPGPGSIYAAWPAGGSVSTMFLASVLGLLEDRQAAALIRYRRTWPSGPLLSVTRTLITRDFLATDCEWILMLDSDMTFTPAAVLALVEAADVESAPIVAGMYFGYVPGTVIGMSIEAGFLDAAGQFRPYEVIPEKPVLDVDCVGAGFMLIHRRVFEALEALAPTHPLPWFEETVHDGGTDGEDYTFCRRARAAGFRIRLLTQLGLGHVKSIPIGFMNPIHAGEAVRQEIERTQAEALARALRTGRSR